MKKMMYLATPLVTTTIATTAIPIEMCSETLQAITAKEITIMERSIERGLTQKEAFHILNLIMANVHTTSTFSQIICHALLTYRETWLRVHFPESYQKMREERKRKTIEEDYERYVDDDYSLM